MPSKIATDTPFSLGTAFWTLVFAFAAGFVLCLILQANGKMVCPADPSAPAPSPAVMQLPEDRF